MLAGAPVAQAADIAPQSSVRADGTAQLADRGDRENRGNRGTRSQRSESRSDRGDRIRPTRSANNDSQRSSRSDERSGRDWNRSDRRSETAQARNYGQRGDAQRNAQRQPSVRETWERGTREIERNRTYSSNDRNRTYSGRDRNDGPRDWSRDRDGWRDRDGNRTSYRGDRDRDRDYRGRDGYRDRDRDGHRWDRRWRDNHRYDWHRYRASNRNLYRVGRYYSPYRSYNYRRLSIGFTLGSLFYSSRYWISDPWRYRLPEVYGPYRWVRYYDDVLLVDMYSGEVVDVIYDFFW
ncbi:RcnB family protein [Croceicoccus naphthovorans]|nr:RcnB family protein [Croceicoccus naphthovorans]